MDAPSFICLLVVACAFVCSTIQPDVRVDKQNSSLKLSSDLVFMCTAAGDEMSRTNARQIRQQQHCCQPAGFAFAGRILACCCKFCSTRSTNAIHQVPGSISLLLRHHAGTWCHQRQGGCPLRSIRRSPPPPNVDVLPPSPRRSMPRRRTQANGRPPPVRPRSFSPTRRRHSRGSSCMVLARGGRLERYSGGSRGNRENHGDRGHPASSLSLHREYVIFLARSRGEGLRGE